MLYACTLSTACATVLVQCGPSHDDQPVFRWSEVKVKHGELPLHIGHADAWGFGWVQMHANGTLTAIPGA